MSVVFSTSKAARRARGSRTASLAAIALLGLLLGALVLSPTASALSQRGHVFSFSFGSQGKGTGQFERPSGIAVNNSNGDVYVADRDNNRVEEFAPEFKEGVLVGETYVTEFKVAYPIYIAVDNSTEASDPSKGDVYVVGARGSEKHEAAPEEFGVYKFSPAGTQIAKIIKYKTTAKMGEEFEEEFDELRGIAVNQAGSLFVYQEEEIYKFNNEEKNLPVSHLHSEAGETRPGLAVDSAGDFYVGVGEVSASDVEDELTELSEEEGEQDGLFEEEEFAVIAKINSAGAVVRPELDPEYTPALAVNPVNEPANEVSEENDVYVANVARIAGEAATTLAAFNPDGSLIQRFSAPGLRYGAGIAVDSTTGAVYVADADANRIDVFELEKHGRPQVDSISSRSVPPPSPELSNVTVLEAQINPTGAATTYQFEYGTTSCATSSCTKVPASPAALGSGFSGFGDREASVELQDLPAGLYHYRVVARSALGETKGPERTFAIREAVNPLPDGREWEMVSPPKKNGAEPFPLTQEGGVIQASEQGNAITYIADGPMPAGSEIEGNRGPEFNQILSARGTAGWTSQDLTTPTEEGLGLGAGASPEYQAFSPDLALALVYPFGGAAKSGGMEHPPLSPPVTAAEKKLFEEGKPYREKTIYLRDDGPEEVLRPEGSEQESYEQARTNGEPKTFGARSTLQNPGYLALVTEADAPGGEPFGGGSFGEKIEGLELQGTTPDLGHVVFESKRAKPGLYEWEDGAGGDGVLHLVNELPGNKETEIASTTFLGGEDIKATHHAISNNGELVFWTGIGGGNPHLYVRDTAREETLRLDTVQEGASGEGEVRARFQTASANGSRVFFTDEQELTPGSKAGLGKRKALYVAERVAGSGEGDSPLSYTLTDLTPEGLNGESADVPSDTESSGGGVLGASEDGSYVYFVANGVLAPGAPRGGCDDEAEPTAATTCNLYERHYNGTEWEPTKFIAPLSFEDAPDWGAGGYPEDLSDETSSVSPNGLYLAFMSELPLTGYENVDASAEAENARDEEVFLYDAETERLVCASCNPSGARPKGVHDIEAKFEGGAPLVADAPDIWGGEKEQVDHWLAGSIPGWTAANTRQAFYQSRYLDNKGRLFFDSPDALVPAVAEEKASKEKVYEYEPDGLGSCRTEGGCVGLISAPGAERESTFLDASASGNDVFFLTASKLLPEDEDTNYDIYDAHVCEASSPCVSPAPGADSNCQSAETCREAYSPAPGMQGPASTGVAAGLVAEQQVLGSKSSSTAKKPKSKPLTRAQKLAKALKACKTKYKAKSKKAKRASCERQARKTYGPKKAKKKAKKSSAKERQGR